MASQRRNIVESLSSAELAFLDTAEHRHSDLASSPSAIVPVDNRSNSPVRLNQPRSVARKPAPASARPEPLRSVTLRLRVATADALRRASIERALGYNQPFTQQAIVEAALAAWLARHGPGSQAAGGDSGPQDP
jgi:hypothetical protein